MYVARCDAAIIGTEEVDNLRKEYAKRFGERFIAFNYADFHGTAEKCAGQVYKETLEEALRNNKPYHIVSRRYEFLDH